MNVVFLYRIVDYIIMHILCLLALCIVACAARVIRYEHDSSRDGIVATAKLEQTLQNPRIWSLDVHVCAPAALSKSAFRSSILEMTMPRSQGMMREYLCLNSLRAPKCILTDCLDVQGRLVTYDIPDNMTPLAVIRRFNSPEKIVLNPI